MGSRRRGRCLASVILLLQIWTAGCAPARGGWDVADLLPSEAQSASALPGRVSDLLPQFFPGPDDLSLFLCRWSRLRPIPVSLPPGASARELRLLRMALAAWESSGLGVSFTEVEQGFGSLEIEFPEPSRGLPNGTADAVADCRLESLDADVSQAVSARLVWASIHLVRTLPDWKGDSVALGDDELLGAMLHELGHALGFSGHVVSGNSIMVAETDKVRRIAERVAKGQPLPAPELVALYSLPLGVRVGRRPLGEVQQTLLQDFLGAAQRAGFSGPFGRVGDHRARVFYRDVSGRAVALTIDDWPAVLRTGRAPVFVPNARALQLLQAENASRDSGRGAQLSERSSSRPRANDRVEALVSPSVRVTHP